MREWAAALALTGRYARTVLPLVTAALDEVWLPHARQIPDPELRAQAIASLTAKRFHAEGGAVYALTPEGTRPDLVALIVALQTISDYLDNLCDRSGAGDPADFRQLHQAWMDALTLEAPQGAYYRLHPQQDDGGYLAALVAECRAGLRGLPAFPAVAGEIARLARWYADLQVYKHLYPIGARAPRLEAWFRQEWPQPGLFWWEFSAACGSTLAIFALLRAATRPDVRPEQARTLVAAYFPAVCGLHILLDYYIDQAEDLEGRDLNLVSPYASAGERDHRLRHFLHWALAATAPLPDAPFHHWVVRGLPALYLNDPKVHAQGLGRGADRLLQEAGSLGRALHRLIPVLRRWLIRSP
ncbi:MAG: tetraprenyl-beta-curcumene synthase family protein [Chloroflexi bacterium]|nr:tetraprenyl-beta-curcumene synthase family protein [Chloroflexota bacterium]